MKRRRRDESATDQNCIPVLDRLHSRTSNANAAERARKDIPLYKTSNWLGSLMNIDGNKTPREFWSCSRRFRRGFTVIDSYPLLNTSNYANKSLLNTVTVPLNRTSKGLFTRANKMQLSLSRTNHHLKTEFLFSSYSLPNWSNKKKRRSKRLLD